MTKELDRRIIYLIIFVALAVPLALRYSLRPAKMQAAENLYQTLEETEFSEGKIAFVSMDFGPNTKAENEAQAKVVIEHLFRKRVPVVMFSLYPYAEPFLKSVPQNIADKLNTEYPEEYWEYGKDWVNLGFRFGNNLLLQSIPKEDNLKDLFKTDVNGTSLNNFAFLDSFKDFKDIKILYEFTGLSGMLDGYLEFFTSAEYRPIIAHGCTSISIPEAYIYLDSNQLNGLLEGLAGAAWYSHLLSENYPNRAKDDALIINTSLGIAQLMIIILILIGNLIYFIKRNKT